MNCGLAPQVLRADLPRPTKGNVLVNENPYESPKEMKTDAALPIGTSMQPQKIISIVGWILSGLLGAALVLSAWFKFFPPEEMAKQMKDSPLLGWILIIGIGELVSAILFLVPRTAVPGTLLLSSYFGGAIVAHMMQRESILVPAIFLVVIWTAALLRLPELRQRVMGGMLGEGLRPRPHD